jgi:hypothetical protein
MVRLIAINVLLALICLSIWHSYRLMRLGRQPGATVNAMLDARREKGLLIFGIAFSVAFALTVLFLSIFWSSLTAWIFLTPLVYLVAWSLPRIFFSPN